MSALVLVTRTVALARALRDRPMEASGLLNRVIPLVLLGRWAEARETLQQGLEIAQELGARLLELQAASAGLYLETCSGRLAAGLDHSERSIRLAVELGRVDQEALNRINRGNAFARLGRPEKAREEFLRSLKLSRGAQSRHTEGGALLELGVLEHEAGRFQEARALAERAHPVALDLGDPDRLYRVHLLLGEGAREQNRVREARQHFEEALVLLQGVPDPGALLQVAIAQMRLPGGAAEEVRTAFLESGSRLEPDHRMEIRFRLFQVQGDAEDLAGAKRDLDHLIEHAPEEYRESMLKNDRLHREIMEAWAEHGGGEPVEEAPDPA